MGITTVCDEREEFVKDVMHVNAMIKDWIEPWSLTIGRSFPRFTLQAISEKALS
jgi:hypothetical protein